MTILFVAVCPKTLQAICFNIIILKKLRLNGMSKNAAVANSTHKVAHKVSNLSLPAWYKNANTYSYSILNTFGNIV